MTLTLKSSILAAVFQAMPRTTVNVAVGKMNQTLIPSRICVKSCRGRQHKENGPVCPTLVVNNLILPKF